MMIDEIQYRSAILEGAQDPETLGATLSRWAKNEDPSIRLAVANNPSTPLDTIYALSRDEDPFIKSAALRQLTFHSIFGVLSDIPAAA